MTFLLGTRASELAVTQSGMVADALRAHGIDVELVTITSHGDQDRTTRLRDMGGIGVFAATLREALLDGRIDLAVHSMKDLPTAAVPGLRIACTPPREDPRDALVTSGAPSLEDLRPGARVGTGSPRRAAQLLHARPDLEIVDIRGNVPTRIARAQGDAADCDAVVLAASGLNRLGQGAVVSQILPIAWAPGQGCLAVETRTDLSAELAEALAQIHDATTWREVTAERAVLARLGAGCAAPVGVSVHDGVLTGVVASEDGRQILTASKPLTTEDTASPDPKAETQAAAQVGERIAESLLAQGAEQICQLHAAAPRRAPGPQVRP